MPSKRLAVVFQPTTMTPRLDAEGEPVSAALYAPSPNPCPNCAAACCASQVEVSVPDFVRFGTALALPFDSAFELSKNAQRPFELDVGPRAVVLRRAADGYCRFIARYDDELRCAVYGLRPATCRIYPFTFKAGEVRLGPRVIRCPVPFGLLPAAERETQKAVRAAAADWALHDEIVRVWARKRKDRRFGTFLRFAIARVYSADGTALDAEASPILWPTGSKARGVAMQKRLGVLR